DGIQAGGTTLLQIALEAHVHRQCGGQCDDQYGGDQGHAALASGQVHPGTSIRRRISPQSCSSSLISTAAGSTRAASLLPLPSGGHCSCQFWLPSRNRKLTLSTPSNSSVRCGSSASVRSSMCQYSRYSLPSSSR